MFIYIFQLIEYAQIPLAKHGLIYLPLLVLSLFFAFPKWHYYCWKISQNAWVFSLSAIAGIIVGLTDSYFWL